MDDATLDMQKISWVAASVACIGLVLVVYGIWLAIRPDTPVVEITRTASESAQIGELIIDVGGAVEKPGVYTLPSGSRIGDALVAAGGLSAQADRDWISKNMNLAQAVKDGGKVYIPENSENSENRTTQIVGVSEKSDNRKEPININTASLQELDTLSDIGEARAQAIIAGRPYSDTGEIVTKAKIPQSVYDKIKDQITVY